MSKEKSNDYFAMMADLAGYCVRVSEELGRILKSYNPDRLEEDLKRLHAIEHESDTRRHDLVAKLVREFITPIERIDIMDITDCIDDVTDAVEDILIKMYMYNVKSLRDDALVFGDLIQKHCIELERIFKEFGNYKRSKTLHGHIVDLNRLEEEADALYMKAVRRLHVTDADINPREARVWSEIYSCMEHACDTCERASDLVENVIMNNS